MGYYCDCAGKHREHRKYGFWVKTLAIVQRSGCLLQDKRINELLQKNCLMGSNMVWNIFFFLKTVTKLALKPPVYTHFKPRYSPSPLIN